jgi:hypothetical protein
MLTEKQHLLLDVLRRSGRSTAYPGEGYCVVLGSSWFSGATTIGIVVIHNGFQYKAYIDIVEGRDPRFDEDAIIRNGVPFRLEAAVALLE